MTVGPPEHGKEGEEEEEEEGPTESMPFFSTSSGVVTFFWSLDRRGRRKIRLPPVPT